MSAFSGRVDARIGRFLGRPDTDRWVWDRQLFLILGYDSMHAPASKETLLRHVPDEERGLVAEAFQAAGHWESEGETSFTVSCRLHAGDGQVRSVLLVAELMGSHPSAYAWTDLLHLDGLAASTGPWMAGQLIDLTELRVSASREAANQAVAASARRRAVIEQAKGALMLTYRMDADAAFAWLLRRSQTTNTKLHDVAAALVAQLPTGRLE